MKIRFLERLSFSSQFLLFSLLALVMGMAASGFWLQREIKSVVIQRTAEVTALYVDTFVAHHVQSLAGGDELSNAATAALDVHLSSESFGRDLVSFKLWTMNGKIAYSSNSALVGVSFSPDEELARAFEGEVVARLSDLVEADNEFERQVADSLIETYAPIRSDDGRDVVAVAEFYRRPDALLSEIRAAQLRGWAVIGSATVLMYLVLFGIVRRVSRLVRVQQGELEGTVDRLSRSLSQNQQLRERMQKAAASATALNEDYLHRISADIHDGPSQGVALALMRVEEFDREPDDPTGRPPTLGNDGLESVRGSLDAALRDLRSIAGGLRLPEIEGLSLEGTVRRVVRDFERVSGTEVGLTCGELPADAPRPVKITIFRVVQEALSNSLRHARASTRTVKADSVEGDLILEVADDGVGFDRRRAVHGRGLGLRVMRDRVEMLGGRFEVASESDHGTLVCVVLPESVWKFVDV